MCIGHELLDSGRGAAITRSYPTSVSGIIVLLNTKHWIKISRISFSIDSSFRSIWWKSFHFPYLDKLKDIGFTPWVESQSDYQKFNVQCLVFNTSSTCSKEVVSMLKVLLTSCVAFSTFQLAAARRVCENVSTSWNNWFKLCLASVTATCTVKSQPVQNGLQNRLGL